MNNENRQGSMTPEEKKQFLIQLKITSFDLAMKANPSGAPFMTVKANAKKLYNWVKR